MEGGLGAHCCRDLPVPNPVSCSTTWISHGYHKPLPHTAHVVGSTSVGLYRLLGRETPVTEGDTSQCCSW